MLQHALAFDLGTGPGQTAITGDKEDDAPDVKVADTQIPDQHGAGARAETGANRRRVSAASVAGVPDGGPPFR